MQWATAAGALRRGEDLVDSIEIVVCTADADAVVDALSDGPDAPQLVDRTRGRVTVRTENADVAVHLPDADRAAATLLYLTGPMAHVDALRALAAENGLRLDADGLFSPADDRLPTATEDDIYAALNLPPIPAEIREEDAAIEAAVRGALPRFVSTGDVLGDLHMHTTWSDGRDSIETMAVAARELNYQFVAITDHSEGSAASHNLRAVDVDRQAFEIARVRKRYPDIEIFHGCEVDILGDGRLDFPDEILESFDIVLASLHEDMGCSGEQLLERYLAAANHPYVNVLTHPANRLVPHRAGYAIDYDRLFAAAAETGTAVEIDGAPTHLDLNGDLARRAAAAGATLTIDSDCHRAQWLGRFMALGVQMARRGWIEPRHVLNTRPAADVRAFVAAKRRRV